MKTSADLLKEQSPDARAWAEAFMAEYNGNGCDVVMDKDASEVRVE